MKIQTGSEVEIIKAGSYPTTRGFERELCERGEVLTVTRVTETHVHGRTLHWRRVIRVPRENVKLITRKLGETPPGCLSPDDPRVAWIFEDAEKMATRLGLCGDYDRICDALGLPGRERKFTIKVAQADGISVTARVTARSRRLAEAKLREQFVAEPRAVTA